MPLLQLEEAIKAKMPKVLVPQLWRLLACCWSHSMLVLLLISKQPLSNVFKKIRQPKSKIFLPYKVIVLVEKPFGVVTYLMTSRFG